MPVTDPAAVVVLPEAATVRATSGKKSVSFAGGSPSPQNPSLNLGFGDDSSSTTSYAPTFNFKNDQNLQFEMQEARTFMRVLQREGNVKFMALANDESGRSSLVSPAGPPVAPVNKPSRRNVRGLAAEALKATPVVTPPPPPPPPPKSPTPPPTPPPADLEAIAEPPTELIIEPGPVPLATEETQKEVQEAELQPEPAPSEAPDAVTETPEPSPLDIPEETLEAVITPEEQIPVVVIEATPEVEPIQEQSEAHTDFEPGFFFNEEVEPEPSSIALGLSRPSTSFTAQERPVPSPVAFVKVTKEHPRLEPELYDATLMMKRWNRRQQTFLQQLNGNSLTALSNYSLSQKLYDRRAETIDNKYANVGRARILEKLGKLALEERRRQLVRTASAAPWRDAVWSAPAALQEEEDEQDSTCSIATTEHWRR
ncbi:hypothetical protein HDV00_003055 [Rhizophlyctis rosea]|nr:hypothetical protein HDV00_003055 [Rhizophlyctis rosea]